MKRLLTLGFGVALALTMMDFPQVVKAPSGLTLVKGGGAFAADLGKGKAPVVVGKGKAPVVARG
jgi:hypothetical protein